MAGAVLDRLLGLLDPARGDGAWAAAPPYLRRHAVEHAADAGRADELLTDAGFLVHADPVTLVPALDGFRSRAAAEAVAVYRAGVGVHRYMEPGARRAVLALDACGYRLPALAEAFRAGLPPDAPRPRWRTGGRMNSALRDSTSGVPQTVTAVAPAVVAGRPALVTGGWNGRVRVWDLFSGRFTGRPLWGHSEVVWRTASVGSVDGHALLVSAEFDGTVQVWDADDDGGRHVCQVPTRYGVPQVACALVDGAPVVLVAEQHSTTGPRVWDLTASDWRGGALPGPPGGVSALACYEAEGAPMAVGAGRGTLVRWDLRTGERHGEPLPCLPGAAAVACTSVAGRPFAVVVGGTTVQCFDLSGPGRLLHTVERAHDDTLYAVDCVAVGDVPVAVTGGYDTTVRTWNVLDGTPFGETWRLHTDTVTDIACTRVAGRPVAATADRQGLMRVWALDAEPVGAPLAGHRYGVRRVWSSRVGGRPVVASAGSDGREPVLVWDARTGDPVDGAPEDTGPADPGPGGSGRGADGPAAVVGGTEVRLVTVADGTVVVRDAATGLDLGVLAGHTGPVHAVVCTTAPDGTPLAVTGSQDLTVRVWDLARFRQHGPELTGHTRPVTALACAAGAGRTLVFSAGSDGSLRTWDAGTGSCLHDWPVLRAVGGLSTVEPGAPGEPGSLLMALGSDVAVFDLPSVGDDTDTGADTGADAGAGAGAGAGTGPDSATDTGP
ncbi:hypothetical protein [Streptomyces sp. NPDC048603]|uniref:WD40 repeat domain-containing protein n=1 Tax=Streptomyces sp. NPDC048603 TaxID=3365577 RepID=UPI003721F403